MIFMFCRNAHYEQITINCAMVLTSPNAKTVMNKLPFTLNCTNVMEIEGDVDLRRKVQPVFEKFFSKWFLTYRTDVRIITEQSKTKMSMGRDLGAAAVSRDRSEKLLCDRRMRGPWPGSYENQSGSC